MQVQNLIANAGTFTQTGVTEATPVINGSINLHATIVGTGSLSAVIKVQGSNNPKDASAWIDTGVQVALSGTGSATSSDSANTTFAFHRIVVVSMSAGATVHAAVSGYEREQIDGGTVARASLNSYTMTPGEILFNTDTSEPPAPTGAAGTAVRTNAMTWQGGQTWRLSNTTDGGNIAFTIPVNVPAQPAMVGMFLPVFIENYEAMLGFQVFVSMGDETYTNVYRYEWGVGPAGNEDKKRDGWHLIHIPPSAWVVDSGSPASQAIRSVRLRWVRQPGANDATVFLGSPRVGVRPRTQVLIYADDVPQSFYKNALPIFDAYGLPVNLACAANWTATSQYMTTAMFQDAISRGHEVCCHSTNRIGVQLTTLEQVRADILLNQSFVRNVLGQEFGAKHWVFANGQYWINSRDDLNVLTMMRDELGIVMARTTDDPLRPTTRSVVGLLNDTARTNLLTIPETLPNNTSTTQAAVLSQLDAAIASGDLVTLVYHEVTLNAAIAMENTACVEAVAKRLARAVGERELDVVRASDFYTRLTPFV